MNGSNSSSMMLVMGISFSSFIFILLLGIGTWWMYENCKLVDLLEIGPDTCMLNGPPSGDSLTTPVGDTTTTTSETTDQKPLIPLTSQKKKEKTSKWFLETGFVALEQVIKGSGTKKYLQPNIPVQEFTSNNSKTVVLGPPGNTLDTRWTKWTVTQNTNDNSVLFTLHIAPRGTPLYLQPDWWDGKPCSQKRVIVHSYKDATRGTSWEAVNLTNSQGNFTGTVLKSKGCSKKGENYYLKVSESGATLVRKTKDATPFYAYPAS